MLYRARPTAEPCRTRAGTGPAWAVSPWTPRLVRGRAALDVPCAHAQGLSRKLDWERGWAIPDLRERRFSLGSPKLMEILLQLLIPGLCSARMRGCLIRWFSLWC